MIILGLAPFFLYRRRLVRSNMHPGLIIKSGYMEQQSFMKLYHRYQQPVRNTVVRYVGSQRADDLVQDIFLKIWLNRNSYNREKGRIFSWLMRLTINTCVDYIRLGAYRLETATVPLEWWYDPGLHPDQLFERLEAKLLLARLSLYEQRIMDQKYRSGYTQAELAGLYQAKLGTFKAIDRRIHLKLKRIHEKDASIGDHPVVEIKRPSRDSFTVW